MACAPPPEDVDPSPEPPKSDGAKFFSLSAAADISVIPEINVDDFPIQQADPSDPRRKADAHNTPPT
jgi:hypothetical protein